jgi:hypothetical protein
MKKTIFILLLLGFISLQLFAATDNFVLKTSEATLTIDPKGNLKIIQGKGEVIQVNCSINDVWRVVLRNSLNNREYEFTSGKNVKLNKDGEKFTITVADFQIENKNLPVIAEFTISVKDDAFCFSGSLKSESDEWIFKELDYPVLPGIRINDPKTTVYWPEGLGQCFEDPESFGSKSSRYPGGQGAAMAWFSVNSSKGGLYVGSHDPLQETRVFNLSYDKTSKLFKSFINSAIQDKSYTIADVMIKPYAGEWYKASKFYRAWYDHHFKTANPPQWVKTNSGWLLAILKQQNMEIMWPYKDIDKLCDIADQFNLGTLGLFGWTIGGHDHLYPYYNPDNLMGGPEELKKAIERAHKRGKKVILYANGKIMDTSTDFYRYNGFETMVIQENRQPQIQYYIKQKNATPVIFAQACVGSELWRKTMYDLGLQAVSLGADGILYDQMGIMGVYLCYAKNHDHLPGMSDLHNRLDMINKISADMKKINPDFIIMTEGTNDVVIRGIDYHHGCGVAAQPGLYAFPELFRYTFPELLKTQRNPNPMITRTDANYAAISGLRHEIETRYAGDVAYLLKGTLPKPEDYSNVVSPPDLTKMNLLPAKEATEYVHTLIAFEDKNPDFFRYGKFIARDGIEVTGTDIVSNGFLNKNRMGVVVWNKNLSEKRDFRVTVPGYKMISASEPHNNNVNATATLGPNTIRLVIFEKN